MDYGVIYALSVNGRDFRYVGLTKRAVELRLAQHEKTARSGREASLPVHVWMREHGPVQVTVLSHARIADLHGAERWWIAELKALGYDLLNRTSGGQGTFGWIPTAETRARISVAMAGKKRAPSSEEKRRKIGIAHKGMKRSAETRAKISAAAKGRKLSPEHIAAIVAAHKGKPITEEHRLKIQRAHQARSASRHIETLLLPDTMS